MNKQPTKKIPECCETPMEHWMAVLCGEYYAEYECFFSLPKTTLQQNAVIIGFYQHAIKKAEKDPDVKDLVEMLQLTIKTFATQSNILKKRQKRRIQTLQDAKMSNANLERIIENLLLYEAEMPKGLWEMEKPQD